MNKIITKAVLVFAFASFANVVFGQMVHCSETPPRIDCNSCKEVPETRTPCNCAYNAPLKRNVKCPWDMSLSGSFVFWKPIEKGLNLGSELWSDDASDNKSINPVKMDFDFHPGYKLGLGLISEKDDWVLFCTYTRLKSRESNSKNIADSYDADHHHLIPNWDNIYLGSSPANYMKGIWDISYNIVDLEIKRSSFLGKKVILTPSLGLRGGWIDQKYDFYSTIDTNDGFVDSLSRNKQDSKLIGPRAALNFDWLLGEYVKIFSNVSVNLLYQQFELSHNGVFPLNVSPLDQKTSRIQDKFSYITPNIEFILGMGFETYLCHDEYHFDLNVGYDFSCLWNQNFMRYLISIQNPYAYNDSDAGNLLLHGLNVTARIDF